MAPPKGTRVSLSTINPKVNTDPGRVPPAPEPGSRPVRIGRVAPNPLNKRRVDDQPDKTADLAAALQEFGQMKACTVVTVGAFVAKFPEHTDAVAGVDYVQVDGARRRAAALLAELPQLVVTVDDDYVRTRARFVGATVTENLNHLQLNPVEEAEQLAVLVEEVGSSKEAAGHLRRTPAWATQRLNLLKLVDEVQDAVRTGEMPVFQVRELHRATPAEQLAALAAWRRKQAGRERQDEQGDRPAPAARPSRAAAAIRRLGGTPVRIAESLRAELQPDDVRALIAELQRSLDD